MGYRGIEAISTYSDAITLIINNGFEDRATRGLEIMFEKDLKVNNVLMIKYEGKENEGSYKKVIELVPKILKHRTGYREVPARDIDRIRQAIEEIVPRHERVVCDITGLSRSLILNILSMVYKKHLEFAMIYTEASEYYPTLEYFKNLLRLSDKSRSLSIRDPSEAYKNLTDYEEADIVYSSSCDIEEIADLSGRIFPNHPILLISFLTYKRSRLSCILNQYETNARILIKGVPVRRELKWRDKALDIINFDIVEQDDRSIKRLSTLNWRNTYEFLERQLCRDHIRYRYNILLAPLGSKMQTVGAWLFAIRNPEVKVIVSIPRRHYPGKYSSGYKKSFFIDMRDVYNSQSGAI